MSHLSTPVAAPWTQRQYDVDDDPRGAFSRDRDRIIHSEALQNLQHKTQVYIVHEADFYRTRLTHTLEVAQISRTIARLMGLAEPLVEAIALAHDVGHTPFGHAGEEALDGALKNIDETLQWDSNHHSLVVLDELELAYADHRGLNLTFATRQGVARHQSPFDRPRHDFDTYSGPTLECQVVNLADFIAYSVHDVKDALKAGLLNLDALRDEPALRMWRPHLRRADSELHQSNLQLHGDEPGRLLSQRAGRHLINRSIHDLVTTTGENVETLGIGSFDELIDCEEPVVALSGDGALAATDAVNYLIQQVYHSPLVARQNFKAHHVIHRLFSALVGEPQLLPESSRARTHNLPRKKLALEVARYIAGLTDRAAIDLYAELFDPRDRAMGHHKA